MRPIHWLWVLAGFACMPVAGCATPTDPVDSQMQCIQDPECRARLEHQH